MPSRRTAWNEATVFTTFGQSARIAATRKPPKVIGATRRPAGLAQTPLSHLVGLICLVEVPASAGVEDQRSGGEVPQA